MSFCFQSYCDYCLSTYYGYEIVLPSSKEAQKEKRPGPMAPGGPRLAPKGPREPCKKRRKGEEEMETRRTREKRGKERGKEKREGEKSQNL